MKKEKLEMLKLLYEEEKLKREKIHRLIKNDNVLAFFEMTNKYELLKSIEREYSLNPEDIFYDVIKKMKLNEVSNIYFISYELNDSTGRLKLYSDLENYDRINDIKKLDEDIDLFEKAHDVLDSNNLLFKEHGRKVVQYKYFKESLENGEEVAKKKILEMYGNLRNK